MLRNIGDESDYSTNDMKPLTVKKDVHGHIIELPEIESGWHIVCAFNRFGLKGKAKMIVCETLEDMNQLIDSHKSGNAVSIQWNIISSSCLRLKYPHNHTFFQYPKKSFASMFEETFVEDYRRQAH